MNKKEAKELINEAFKNTALVRLGMIKPIFTGNSTEGYVKSLINFNAFISDKKCFFSKTKYSMMQDMFSIAEKQSKRGDEKDFEKHFKLILKKACSPNIVNLQDFELTKLGFAILWLFFRKKCISTIKKNSLRLIDFSIENKLPVPNLNLLLRFGLLPKKEARSVELLLEAGPHDRVTEILYSKSI